MMEEWAISVDENGQPWLVKVITDSRIGPFRDMQQAEAARAELAAAAQQDAMQ